MQCGIIGMDLQQMNAIVATCTVRSQDSCTAIIW